MIDFIIYKYELRSLFCERRAIRKKFEPLIKNEHPQDRSGILFEEHSELIFVEDRIHRVVTNQLWEQAKRLMVPIPSSQDEGMWEPTETQPGSHHLSVKGVAVLREAIRVEKQARWKFALLWMAPLTGLIGACTGLIAVIIK